MPGDQLVQQVLSRGAELLDRRRGAPGAGQLGARPRAGLGRPGPRLARAHGLRRPRRAARGARPVCLHRDLAGRRRTGRIARLRVGRYAEWLDYFERLQIEAVGLGWLVLHRAGRDEPVIRVEDWPHPLEQPIGPALAAELPGGRSGATAHRTTSCSTGAGHWPTGVIAESVGQPGAADPEHLIFRQQARASGGRSSSTPRSPAVLGACDGELTLGQIIRSVAQLLAVEESALTERVLERLGSLVVDGFLGCAWCQRAM